MNVSAASNEIEEKRREEEGQRRVIVRGERMKFTELHIAVVTFHLPPPAPWNLFSSFSFCRMRFSWVT